MSIKLLFIDFEPKTSQYQVLLHEHQTKLSSQYLLQIRRSKNDQQDKWQLNTSKWAKHMFTFSLAPTTCMANVRFKFYADSSKSEHMVCFVGLFLISNLRGKKRRTGYKYFPFTNSRSIHRDITVRLSMFRWRNKEFIQELAK